MRIGKWLFLALLLTSSTAVAQDKIYMAVCNMPFQGYYQNNGFHDRSDGNTFAWDIRKDFIMELPGAFPRGGIVNGINADGSRIKLTVKKVDTGVLLENDYIIGPPIAYEEKKCASLIWTGDIDIHLVETNKTKIPDAVFTEINKSLASKEKIKFSEMEGFTVEGLANRLFIQARKLFFIYSQDQNKILFKPGRRETIAPTFYFRINNSDKLYILIFTAYNDENGWSSILEARSGETLLKTFY